MRFSQKPWYKEIQGSAERHTHDMLRLLSCNRLSVRSIPWLKELTPPVFVPKRSMRAPEGVSTPFFVQIFVVIRFWGLFIFWGDVMNQRALPFFYRSIPHSFDPCFWVAAPFLANDSEQKDGSLNGGSTSICWFYCSCFQGKRSLDRQVSTLCICTEAKRRLYFLGV